MASDAPDWQKVIVIVSGGTVTDAPDWERVVTGPGGGFVGGYASMTGTGATNPAGKLHQTGPFEVTDPNADLVFSVDALTGEIDMTAGALGFYITSVDTGLTGIQIVAASSVIVIDASVLSFFGKNPAVGQQVSGGTTAGVIAGLVALGLFSS